jgi:hypothetical protein
VNVEVRTIDGATLGKGRMISSVALGLQRLDQVVFPFVGGCWIIQVRHILVSKFDGEAEMTFLVDPRDP